MFSLCPAAYIERGHIVRLARITRKTGQSRPQVVQQVLIGLVYQQTEQAVLAELFITLEHLGQPVGLEQQLPA